MAKRPQGLSKASKNKKLKNSQSSDAKDDAEPQKITIELDQDIDPDDGLGQLRALYETYVKTKNQFADSEETEDLAKLDTCQKLLAGIIHECDHLLRNSETDSEQNQDITPEFHNIYALALLGMAFFADLKDGEKQDDTSEAFILAAIDRANTGMDDHQESIVWPLYFTLAKAKVELANDQIKRSEEIEQRYEAVIKALPLLEEAIADYEKAEELVFAHDKSKLYTHDQLDTIELLLQIGDGIGALGNENEDILQDKQTRYLDWSKTRWQQILEKVPASKGKAKLDEGTDNSVKIFERANKGLGEYYLAVAAPLLARFENADDEDEDEDDEEEDEEDEDEEVEALNDQELASAKELMGQAVQYLLKAENEQDGATHVMTAEAQISLANLYEVDSDEQKVLYRDAVTRLKRAQRLGYGSYQDLISELEES